MTTPKSARGARASEELCDLSFRHVGYRLRRGGANNGAIDILQDCTGTIRSTALTAILGSSGAGCVPFLGGSSLRSSDGNAVQFLLQPSTTNELLCCAQEDNAGAAQVWLRLSCSNLRPRQPEDAAQHRTARGCHTTRSPCRLITGRLLGGGEV